MLVHRLPDASPPVVVWAPTPVLPPWPPRGDDPARTPAPPTGPTGRTPDRAAVALVTAMAEVLSGRRPASQLARWASEDVVAALSSRARAAAEPLVVRSVRMQDHGRSAELAVRLQGGTRHHALAIGLQRRGQRWLCVAAELGPTLR